ncbi:hypothetical protein [Amycolatopsis sp. FDAARGOS 1241]|uniref:hypothetical protein n=1 Tax=Amycolatopsis sp. FDAARGOS 1241 TaxID=2778070 RepID=UPI0019502610|nr:hypothetical protein [Amycolatopsis sp. FDAARGOS 1241]QRP48613.1 hypothetical protein I6J71_12685 [Amycolatopsis sp. FDAARGOS 1241]
MHQVCAPHPDKLERLPTPRRAALTTAFELAEGSPPDPFVAALAVLTLLTEAAAEQPLVGVIDDAQLDSASMRTLSMVVRRLRADPVAMVFVVRDGEQNRDLAYLERLPELLTGRGDRGCAGTAGNHDARPDGRTGVRVHPR